MIQRTLLSALKEQLFSGKAILLFGPRQVGKTTLLKQLIGTSEDALWLNGDELDVQQLFDTLSATRMKALIGTKKILILDEAQRILNIGLRLKLLTDTLPELQVIATGSSSFELANQVNESLTGRKWEYQLYPISFAEMVQVHGLLEEKRLLPHRLVYGYYPEIVTQLGNEKNVFLLFVNVRMSLWKKNI
jgi:predicted AAA+ superfamily ATPase